MAFRHPIYDDETEALRAQIRRFCEKEIRPHMEAWEEAGEMPREVYKAAAKAGRSASVFQRNMATAAAISCITAWSARNWRRPARPACASP